MVKRAHRSGAVLLLCSILAGAAAALSLSPGAVSAEESASRAAVDLAQDEDYRATVRELLAKTGSLKLGMQMANAVVQSTLQSMQGRRAQLSPEAVRMIQETAQEQFSRVLGDENEIVAAMAVIYAKHFSKAELEGLLAFYRTPLGAKTISEMPAILAEAMEFGQKRAQAVLPALQAELKRRLDEAKSAQPAAP